MKIAAAGQFSRQQVARLHGDPAAHASLRYRPPRHLVDRRFLENRGFEMRMLCHDGAGVNARATRDVKQMGGMRAIQLPRHGQAQVDAAAIHRRGELVGELFVFETAPIRDPAGSQNGDVILANRSVLEGGVIRPNEPRRAFHQVLAGQFRNVEDPLPGLDQAQRRKQREHHVGRTLDDLQLATNGPLVRRMLRQPGEEIKIDQRRPQQIGRVDPVPQSVDFDRIRLRRDRQVRRCHGHSDMPAVPALAICNFCRRSSCFAPSIFLMRTLLVGIDSGTQSTKVLVVDAKNGKVLAVASQGYELLPGLPPGAKEQHPHTWRDATGAAIRQALRGAKANPAEIKAIGVSGQQHGFVPLDPDGQVIRPAKLWCDTSTTAECDEINEKLGGFKKAIRTLGNAVLPGFTASKILWLKKHEPKNYARLATVLLPHDYLNFWLTGEKVMEYGDASGTALLDIRKRKWSSAALDAIDPALAGKLPPLRSSDQPAGILQPSTAKLLDLRPDVLVSAGGGDNMMGAIGTGNTREGVITASFGTSGTIYACAEKPVVDPEGEDRKSTRLNSS